jgi:hypothetical protein
MGSLEISLLRVTDDAGHQLACACVPAGAGDRVCIGEPDSWLENCRPVTSVIFDCSGAVQITDARDISALAAWLSAAAVWLKTVQLTEEQSEWPDSSQEP